MTETHNGKYEVKGHWRWHKLSHKLLDFIGESSIIVEGDANSVWQLKEMQMQYMFLQSTYKVLIHLAADMILRK